MGRYRRNYLKFKAVFDTYLTSRFAKRALLIGTILYGLSLLLNFAVLLSAYGKAGSCLGKTGCSVATESMLGKVAMIGGYIGLGMILVGFALLLIV